MAKHVVELEGVEFTIETDSLSVSRYLQRYYTSSIGNVKTRAHLCIMLEPCFNYSNVSNEPIRNSCQSLVFEQPNVAGYLNLFELRGVVRIKGIDVVGELLTTIARHITKEKCINNVS